MENLSAHTDSLSLALCAYRADHKLLECDRSVRVCTTVDDVHHRNRKYISVGSADVAVKRHIEIVCCSVCNCKADAEDGVCAELALGRSAVELNHSLVDRPLLES